MFNFDFTVDTDDPNADEWTFIGFVRYSRAPLVPLNWTRTITVEETVGVVIEDPETPNTNFWKAVNIVMTEFEVHMRDMAVAYFATL